MLWPIELALVRLMLIEERDPRSPGIRLIPTEAFCEKFIR